MIFASIGCLQVHLKGIEFKFLYFEKKLFCASAGVIYRRLETVFFFVFKMCIRLVQT